MKNLTFMLALALFSVDSTGLAQEKSKRDKERKTLFSLPALDFSR